MDQYIDTTNSIVLNTSVLFIVFNRPDTTQRVFEAIRQAQPRQLFIAADGPRINNPADAEKCRQVQAIVNGVDWNCEVKTLFRETNLGCKYAVSTAIDWFFAHVEEGIILEDDTVPDPTFFAYCTSLLSHYRHVSEVMHISGVNFQFGRTRGRASYYFSKYAHVWGWASWRRAWNCYDVHMAGFPDFVEQRLQALFKSREELNFWVSVFRLIIENKVDTWDMQWLYAVWKHHGVCITPNVNLISNIGFGEGATHTVQQQSRLANMATGPMPTPLKHPAAVAVDHKADDYVFTHAIHVKPDVFASTTNRIKALIPGTLRKKLSAFYNESKKISS